MTLIEPGVCRVDVIRGQLVGATSRYVKTLADLEGLYEDAVAFDALKGVMRDEIVYEVTDYKPSANPGDMIMGVTRIRPGKVGREYFLTRGHIHANANRPEMYYGESGCGLMLLESPGRRNSNRRNGTADSLLRSTLLDSSFCQHRFCPTGDDLRISGRCRSGLRNHRGSGWHEKPRRR